MCISNCGYILTSALTCNLKYNSKLLYVIEKIIKKYLKNLLKYESYYYYIITFNAS